jgi:hypothetical protein
MDTYNNEFAGRGHMDPVFISELIGCGRIRFEWRMVCIECGHMCMDRDLVSLIDDDFIILLLGVLGICLYVAPRL